MSGVATEQAEYDVVRGGGAGLIDLASQRIIQLRGREVVQFLNGMITNDVPALADHAWMLAAFPTVQGRLNAFVRVLRLGDAFWLVTDAATHAWVFQNLHKFTFAGDFNVHDAAGEVTILSVQGADAARIVATTVGRAAADVERGRVALAEFHESSFPVIRATHTGEDGFDLFVPAGVAENLRETLLAGGARTINADALEVLRVEAGLALYGADIDETNVVLESGLDEAVSYTKGCYLGQEIIARIHWRGHVARRVAGIAFAGAPEVRPGDKLKSSDGKDAGRISSTVFSPRLNARIALALVKYASLEPGTELVAVIAAGEEVPARVAALPFVRGGWWGEAG
ncbi:MAG TPA: glycine cleavage T C-terminal barrel domain-containing protein [Pyrinomonadaceae bacterium]|jgi:folate-binding protein YgfZ|nr:glycine cleavage T C-terminal barrel domain-containing protein [Pyrinomonadaceae bacterium]